MNQTIVSFSLLSLLFILCFPSIIHAQSCHTRSLSLNASNSHLSLLNGINFVDTPSLSDPDGYHLCLQVGSPSIAYSKARQVQLDTGSVGVVLPLPAIPSGTFNRTGRCRSFTYITSNNAYFGEFVSTSLRIFGANSDGRFIETHPMIILAVEYTCTGKNCLPTIASFNDTCNTTRSFLQTNPNAQSLWKNVSTSSTIGMFGVGYNRGNSEADPALGVGPYPLSRNPLLKINVSPLLTKVKTSPINPIAPNTTSYCSSIINPAKNAGTPRCFRDSLDPHFALNSSFISPASITPIPGPSVPISKLTVRIPKQMGGVYAYIISAEKLRFLISAPFIVNPLPSPIFQCGLLNSLSPSSQWAGGSPSFSCWDSETYEGKTELLSSEDLSSSVIWRGKGSLVPDTGINYYVHNVPNYPCMTGKHALRVSLINNETNRFEYSFVFDMNTTVGTAPSPSTYYATNATSPHHLPPTKFRLWPYDAGVNGCSNSINLAKLYNVNMNTGRMILSSFVYLFDALHGVVGYANAREYRSKTYLD